MLHKPSEPDRSIANHSLISIHPDETLYSWCATNHAMSCCRNSETTASELLGAAHAVRQHEFPHSLEKFIAISRVEPASILRLLREHTVAGFYLPFLSEKAQRELASEALHPHSTHWVRAALGSSRTRQVVHPLKWCRRCIQDDIATIGRPFWHTTHQSPIALICPLHNEPLHWRVQRSKQWRLPRQDDDVETALPDTIQKAACMAAALSAHLQKTPFIDMTSLRRCALYRLQEIGVIHSVNGARHERVAQWFTSTTACAIARIAQPKFAEHIDGSSIPRLLWRQKRTTAISWMLLWSALQWKSSNEAIHSFADAAAGHGAPIRGQLQLFSDLEAGTRKTPEYVRDAFQTCDSYAQVMESLKVSRHDVVRWLESDPELRIEWKARMRAGKLLECIERIKNCVKNAPQTGSPNIEKSCSAELRWMRDHAPNQLATLLKSVPNKGSAQAQLDY